MAPEQLPRRNRISTADQLRGGNTDLCGTDFSPGAILVQERRRWHTRSTAHYLLGYCQTNLICRSSLTACHVARMQSLSGSSPPHVSGGKKEKREKKGTVWHDGSGSGKQLGQKAKEALDRSKVRSLGRAATGVTCEVWLKFSVVLK